jgi:protein CpxP
MKINFNRAGLTLGLVASLTATTNVFGQQQPTTQTPPAAQGSVEDGQRRRAGRFGKRRGMRRHGMKMGGLRALNLTDAQREQLRALRQRNAEGFRPKREEMRQLFELRRNGQTLTPEQEARAEALRQEFRAAHQSRRQEMLNLLTPEQRTQLEQTKKERKERRQQMRQQMRERRMERDNNTNQN